MQQNQQHHDNQDYLPDDGHHLDADRVDSSNNSVPRRAPDIVTLRALLTTKEAGIIIGKGGKNVADLRDITGVKAGVSNAIPHVPDRVLTVTGSVDQISKAYGYIAGTLLEAARQAQIDGGMIPPAPSDSPRSPSGSIQRTVIRLLISHNLMGSIIGRQGARIKQIQDASGTKMTASKDMLPQSTERTVEVQGSPGAIERSVLEIMRSLSEDWDRGIGAVLYDPRVCLRTGMSYSRGGPGGYHMSRPYYGGGAPGQGYGGGYGGPGAPGGMSGQSMYDTRGFGRAQRTGRPRDDFSRPRSYGAPTSPGGTPYSSGTRMGEGDDVELRTQSIAIPQDMVGCIIGRGGMKIQEIRKHSGCRIVISSEPLETGERLFTITGTAEANEKALYLLHEQLEKEKARQAREAEIAAEGQKDDAP